MSDVEAPPRIEHRFARCRRLWRWYVRLADALWYDYAPAVLLVVGMLLLLWAMTDA